MMVKAALLLHDPSPATVLSVPVHRGRIENFRTDLKAAALKDTASAKLLTVMAQDETASAIIDAAVSGSPFLASLMQRYPSWAWKCIHEAPDHLIAQLLNELSMAGPEQWRDMPSAQMSRLLRQVRQRAALTLGLADITEVLVMDEVTQHLTEIADACVSAAVSFLLSKAEARDQLRPGDANDPAKGCGYVILAMGKQGAFELNYSSDIDLIVLYDPDQAPLVPGVEPAKFFVRLTRALVGLLNEVTEHGIAYRVDLRLRPDPGATQVAISMEAAAIYYENLGQNWERAAMIKARPIAGDLEIGRDFLARLSPYIWRKYLDFAAIADVQSMKRQIHAVKGHSEIKVAGHNLKLGRGGIREIEFFVQTQQLIAGGRVPALRGAKTLDMLETLALTGWIDAATAQELAAAYHMLRMIEHRLQMVEDAQTHTLPEAPKELAAFAAFAGYDEASRFEADLLAVLRCVQGHYAALFEQAEALGTGTGPLVFTGAEDDPDTLDTLAKLGFKAPAQVSAAVRGWHFGRYAATRAAKTRERLTEIMPMLLQAMADAGDPDQTFNAFDRFLAQLPAGLQLFSMLRANRHVLELLLLILGTAPRAARELGRRVRVLDAVLDQDFFDHLPEAAAVDEFIGSAIGTDLPLELALDRARVVGKELQFRIDVRLLSRSIDVYAAGAAYSLIADHLIKNLLKVVHQDFEQRHGRLKGGELAVIGMGKLGSQELSAGSDLDLILIYDFDAAATQSDGAKPLSPNQYYARLTQRMIAALSSPTSEGVLYDVDMRLRPSGNKGPIATQISGFENYQAEEAWTWERLALVRARVVSGPAGLTGRINEAIRDGLVQAKPAAEIMAETAEMRGRIFTEHGSASPWDVKHVKGGLIDIEFITQALQLAQASHLPFGVPVSNTAKALAALTEHAVLKPSHSGPLCDGHRLMLWLNQLLSLCLDQKTFDARDCPRGLERLLCASLGEPSLSALEDRLREAQRQCHDIFCQLIGRY